MSTSFQSLRVGSGKTRGISSSDRLVSSILTCFIIKGVPTVMPPKRKGNNEPYMNHIHGADPCLARRWGIICFYAPVSVWFVIEWMMSHAMGSFEEGEAMLADDLKAVQRKIVKDSFADKMAALKKQEAEFSDLVSDLFALRSLHDSLQEKMNAYRDTYLHRDKARLVLEAGVTTAELRYIMSASTSLEAQAGEEAQHSEENETPAQSDMVQE